MIKIFNINIYIYFKCLNINIKVYIINENTIMEYFSRRMD